MKKTVYFCDICYHKDNKEVEGGWKVGFRNNIKLDVCDKHKSITKDKSAEEWNKFCMDLLYSH